MSSPPHTHNAFDDLISKSTTYTPPEPEDNPFADVVSANPYGSVYTAAPEPGPERPRSPDANGFASEEAERAGGEQLGSPVVPAPGPESSQPSTPATPPPPPPPAQQQRRTSDLLTGLTGRPPPSLEPEDAPLIAAASLPAFKPPHAPSPRPSASQHTVSSTLLPSAPLNRVTISPLETPTVAPLDAEPATRRTLSNLSLASEIEREEAREREQAAASGAVVPPLTPDKAVWEAEDRAAGWGEVPGSPATPRAAEDGEQAPPQPSSPIQTVRASSLESNRSQAAPSIRRPPREQDPSAPFQITVGDPQKVGNPTSAHIVYTVRTRTSLPQFRQSSFSVLRRYSDFLWLYEAVCRNNPGVFVPPPPEKQAVGRFQHEFIESRRLALERQIQKTANHPLLASDPDLKLFLESDTFTYDVKHRQAERQQESKGMFASIGSSLVGPRFFETDEWYDNQRTYLDGLEAQLKALVKALHAVSAQRIELASASADLSASLTELSTLSVSKNLAHVLGLLANVQRRAREGLDELARSDVVTLLNTVDEYVRQIGSIRLAFASRVKAHAAWMSAESALKKRRALHEKQKAQGQIHNFNIDQALAELTEAERRVHDARGEFDDVGKLVKAEMARFNVERIEDVRNALDDFLESLIAGQKAILAAWEEYHEVLLRHAPNGAGKRPQQPQQQAVVGPSSPGVRA